jgi:hypothetical protein
MKSEMSRYHTLGKVCDVCEVRKPKATGFPRIRSGGKLSYKTTCTQCDAVIKIQTADTTEMKVSGCGKACTVCGVTKPKREGYRRVRNPDRNSKTEYIFSAVCKMCEPDNPPPLTKVCKQCNQDKLLSDYSPYTIGYLGRCVRCRACCAGDKYGVSKTTDQQRPISHSWEMPGIEYSGREVYDPYRATNRYGGATI